MHALDGVTISFMRGQYSSIMGPSGSGKSTLMHCLAGLDRPTSGSVQIDGTEITTLDDKRLTDLRREKIGFIFQAFNLLPVLTAEENITLPLTIAGRDIDQAWVDKLIETVGLTDRRKHRPSEMSGGQQQRVAIARALVTRPAVVFADEPTGNLDSKSSAEVLQLLRNAVDEFNQTVVMVTHDPDAASVGDRLIVLRDGRICHDGISGDRQQVDELMRTAGVERAPDEGLDGLTHDPGAPVAQGARAPDRARRAAGRRDDLRHLRVHGHDQQHLRQGVRGRERGRRRGRQRPLRVRHRRGCGEPGDPGLPRGPREAGARCAGRGRQRRGHASIFKANGDQIETGGAPPLLFSRPPERFDPLNYVEGEPPANPARSRSTREPRTTRT